MSTDPASVAPLKIAVVGAGEMAQHHAASIRRLPHLGRVVAICDPSPSARARLLVVAPEAEQFETLGKALAARTVDLVHIVTPPATHAELTEQALRAGCHVYVEKPFVEDARTAAMLLSLAAERGLIVCAGHQLLFEPPSVLTRSLLPALGQIRHLESYFSFRVVPRNAEGSAPLRPDRQLIDILPHPVYTLLDFLARADGGDTTMEGLSVGPTGTLHALFRRGRASAVLVVTVEGRPVESYLRVVGTNGSIHADFVRSTVQRHLGPGSSGIDKLLAPYRLARQLVTTTTRAMAIRFFGRTRSYPGLVELFEAFYRSVREGKPSPVSGETILETVRVCEQIAGTLDRVLAAQPHDRPGPQTGPTVALTGGTGFLGKAVAASLIDRGYGVRVLARREPAGWDRVAGVEYVVADLGRSLAPGVLADCDTLLHCAAETAGGYPAHQLNSIDATRNVLEAAATAGVHQIVHMSSISVMAQPPLGGRVSESSPLERNSRELGPYAWGKTESEILAQRLAKDLGLGLRIIRPGAFVDYEHFDPPGLLGKRVGNVYVAIGSRRETLAVADIHFSARTLIWVMEHFAEAPPALHLMDPARPTKADLVQRLRSTNPDLRVVWLPRLILVPLSVLAVVAQKILRPRKPALNVAKTFARQRYDDRLIAELAPAIQAVSGPAPGARPGRAGSAGGPLAAAAAR